jgi:YHS domain-containing protein
MENLLNKPASVLDIIPETVYPTPNISQPIIPTPQTFAQAFSAARRAGLKVFDYKGKKYGTQLKGETETVGKGTGAGATTKQGNTRVTNNPTNDNTPVATVNLPEVEVVAKRYVANIGGKEYGFPSEERKNAFVNRVNRVIHNSLIHKKYGYDPKRNWYRTKIG